MIQNAHDKADSGQQARSKHDAARRAEIDRLREQNARIRTEALALGDYALPQFRSLNEKATGMDL